MNWHTQYKLWGAAITGQIVEVSANISEQGDTLLEGVWDKTARDIMGMAVNPDARDWRRVPEWWALRWLPDELREDGLRRLHEQTLVEVVYAD